MALQPISRRISRRRSQTRSGTAAPTQPASWWRQTPFSLTCSPFSRNPLSASKIASRMPIGVSYWSTTRSLSRTVLRTLYRYGLATRPEVGLGHRRPVARTRKRSSAATSWTASADCDRFAVLVEYAGGQRASGGARAVVADPGLDLHRGRVLARRAASSRTCPNRRRAPGWWPAATCAGRCPIPNTSGSWSGGSYPP